MKHIKEEELEDKFYFTLNTNIVTYDKVKKEFQDGTITLEYFINHGIIAGVKTCTT